MKTLTKILTPVLGVCLASTLALSAQATTQTHMCSIKNGSVFTAKVILTKQHLLIKKKGVGTVTCNKSSLAKMVKHVKFVGTNQSPKLMWKGKNFLIITNNVKK